MTPSPLSTRRMNLLSMELELLGMLTLKEGKVIPEVAAILKPEDFLQLRTPTYLHGYP